jgi:hypothetical protein
MPDDGKVTVANEASEALARWVQKRRDRGQSEERIVRYLMKIWLDFALSKVKQAAAGNREKILNDLSRIVAKFSRRFTPGKKTRITKHESKWAGTLAERVVRKLDYKGARGLRGAAHFRVVDQFVKNRQFAAWHHKAGFFPAYRFLAKTPEDSTGPKYRAHAPGMGRITVEEGLVEIMVANWASAAPVPGRPPPAGIAGLVPGAFDDSLAEVEALLLKFMMEDAMKEGQLAAGSVFTFKI